MKKAKLIEISDGYDIACGNCFSILYGYDEEICPSCGAFVQMDLPAIQMTESELSNAYENRENLK